MKDFREAAAIAIEVLDDYADRAARGDGAPVRRGSIEAVASELDLRPLIRDGGMEAERFRAWLAAYLANSTSLQHPAEVAHQVGVPDTGAALADIVHGVANQPMSIHEMGPAAAAVELAVIEWMLEKVEFEAGAGVLTHGGSLANLTALLAARARAAPEAWTAGTPADLAILAPSSAHYSIARAAGILGLGDRCIATVDVDSLERIRADRLPEALARVHASGRRPLALVAAACATSTGLHDDLSAIGAFCRAHDLWLHVDGAHGASALLSSTRRGLLDGIGRADSVIWDAHKMLRTSGLCAAVLLRRAQDLPNAFHQEAAYLDFDNPEGADVIDRQIECTKAELGLKLFLNLAWRGERGLGRYIDEQYAKALELWELLRERPGFVVPYRPESNILCFRYGEGDQRAIRERLLASGDFHLSFTEVAGEGYLRVVAMSPASGPDTWEALADAVESAATA